MGRVYRFSEQNCGVPRNTASPQTRLCGAWKILKGEKKSQIMFILKSQTSLNYSAGINIQGHLYFLRYKDALKGGYFDICLVAAGTS